MIVEDAGGGLGPLGQAHSGALLGAVVAAFATEGEFLKGRTARRFFSGHILTDAHRRQVFEALANVVVDAGAVETSEALRTEDVARALEQAALRWDGTVARLQSRAGPLRRAVVVRALRFTVVDLALRVFAVLRLDRKPVPGPSCWPPTSTASTSAAARQEACTRAGHAVVGETERRG